ncbi:MAG: UDP-N-acetylmuramoyl-L-alanyl-D-glutamate--2,6-diaminopimelate ligase [Bacteroidales bacterium]|nr:UDP-N-acetylmuramoyl-L-alanyl-D-glutamate--2,6-diaminopimelate ligase [Bacteroidales bacterium]MBP5517822.1 UDP-N-acetylmuramoyl-L-alanyl-D-glutamate--2,6-diaminopimelate ligase [Bacteroidales bacterium]
MRLGQLLKGIRIIREFQGRELLSPDTAMFTLANNNDVRSITADSRKCTRGSLFIAVNGAVADGSKYIRDAIERGAQYIVCENIPEEEEGPMMRGDRDLVVYVVVKSSREAESKIAINNFGNPSRKIKLIGVTGTNGKTSIATLLYNTFTALGHKCGLISTIANYVADKRIPTINTTPGPLELNSLLDQMVTEGCSHCFMEVSSHAVDQERIAGLKFAGGIFTNLTHDHLDYHKTFENYRNCKKRFFDMLDAEAFALVNIDDRNGEFMVQNTKAQVHTYSTRSIADYKTRILEQSIDGMQLNINGTELWCNLIGEYNAENLTAIYGAAMLLGAPHDRLVQIMSSLKSVSGRLEYFRGDDDIIAAVDYAHTPDALENVLKTLKALKPKGDLICVFGCGGDRDKTKRPEMGAIAGNYADRIFVTSDNPRTENPMAIIENIKAGMDADAVLKSKFIPDRIQAIQNAVTSAKPGSIILVAGKGHEDYQIIGTEKHHMDDKETVKEALRLRNDKNLR